MRPADTGRGLWLLILAILPIAEIRGDSSSAPAPSSGSREPRAADSAAPAKTYPGVGAYGESTPGERSGPVGWRAAPRLPAEPLFLRALVPNYDLIEPA
ncbi:MAG: hypothetical protein JXP34_14830, partial [Planctomycetes bacterium]|nr:hypothetical protein [Planctomycetota bacterium]